MHCEDEGRAENLADKENRVRRRHDLVSNSFVLAGREVGERAVFHSLSRLSGARPFWS
jgi:hypothetical protein